MKTRIGPWVACGVAAALAAGACSSTGEPSSTSSQPTAGTGGDDGSAAAAGAAGEAGEAGSGGASGSAGSGGASTPDAAGGAAGDDGGAAEGEAGAAGAAGGWQVTPCKTTPAKCDDIAGSKTDQFYGCCKGETVYWCEDDNGTWKFSSVDCAKTQQVCGYDSQFDAMYCIDKPCTPGSCPAGQQCVDGKCLLDVGPGPGPGPGPDCPNLPPLQCTGTAAHCGEIVPFDPDDGDGYEDYPLNGETWQNQYRSYLRRDTMMMIKYATAKVACKAASWKAGNGGPLGLGDMSEKDGKIPGTSVGQPGHPAGTHTNGFDIDVGYYQVNTVDNHLRAICDHYQNGKDVYHCVSTPDTLDVWRSALFLGFTYEHPSLRVTGVDGKAGALIQSAINTLCKDGWLTQYTCSHVKLAYEETDKGMGWYRFHHHHMHVSFSKPSYPSMVPPPSHGAACLVPGCDRKALDDFLSRALRAGP
jgi:hypothetical protein